MAGSLSSMRRFVVSARLRTGSTEQVRRLLAEGPPFDLEGTSLERHEVFLAKDELIFLFEGPHAERHARDLLQRPRVVGQLSRIAAHISGALRFPSEVFRWEREPELQGLSFGPLPGPGNSDGGPSD